jgi:hypothetical protein
MKLLGERRRKFYLVKKKKKEKKEKKIGMKKLDAVFFGSVD